MESHHIQYVITCLRVRLIQREMPNPQKVSPKHFPVEQCHIERKGNITAVLKTNKQKTNQIFLKDFNLMHHSLILCTMVQHCNWLKRPYYNSTGQFLSYLYFLMYNKKDIKDKKKKHFNVFHNFPTIKQS